MILDLVTIGSPILKEVSKTVQKIDSKILKLTEDMLDTMYYNNGIGLAGVQVGELKRIFVMDVPGYTKEPLICINPVIKKKSKDTLTSKEGCLSIPNFNYDIKRSKSILLEYQDSDGNTQEIVANDLLSICIQHENDHLNGILFIENTMDKEHVFINKLLKENNLPIFF